MAELNNSGTGQWSETDANNTSPPPDGAPVGTFPNQAEGIWRAIMGALKRFWDRINGTVTTTGSAGAYVYTPANTSFPTAYAQGETYVWRANFTNVGGDTLNINGLGAKGLYKPSVNGFVPIAAGDIQNGQIVHSVYDGNLNTGAGGFQLIGGIGGGLSEGYHTAFFSAAGFIDDLTGTLAAPGALSTLYNATYGWLTYYRTFNNAATNTVAVPFTPPKGARTGQIRFRVWGFSSSNDTGNIYCVLAATAVANGGNLAATSGLTQTALSVTFAGKSANLLNVSSWSAAAAIANDADAADWSLTFQRQGANAADTSTVDFNVVAVELQYTMVAGNDQ